MEKGILIDGVFSTPYEVATLNRVKNKGVLKAISLVNNPAVDSNLILFSKNDYLDVLSFDEEQNKIRGVFMRANYPIQRIENGELVFRHFTPEFIEDCIVDGFKTGAFNNNDIEHSNNMIEIGDVTQVIITDEDFSHNNEIYKKGTAIIEYKLTNEKVKEFIENGVIKGYSVSLDENKIINFKKEEMNKLKQKLDILFSKSFKTEGEYTFSKLEVGETIYKNSEDNMLVTIEDGEHTINDLTFTSADGKIVEFMKVEIAEKKPDEVVKVTMDDGQTMEFEYIPDVIVEYIKKLQSDRSNFSKQVEDKELEFNKINEEFEAIRVEKDNLVNELEALKEVKPIEFSKDDNKIDTNPTVKYDWKFTK